MLSYTMICGSIALSQKLENQLNLALETPESVREQTEDLNVGFNARNRTWELIVKYNGNPETLRTNLNRFGAGITLEPLIAGYAILTVPDGLAEAVAQDPKIEYVEKPKSFYFDQEGPSARACIASVTAREPFLSGKGVLIAVIDSGLSYRLREFRRADGRTRVKYYWDQTLSRTDTDDVIAGQENGGGAIAGMGNAGAVIAGLENSDVTFSGQQRAEEAYMGLPGPPAGFSEGVEFDEAWINEALFADTEAEGFARMPTIDVSGHGTAVAAIAGGSLTGAYQGVARESEFLIVKLGGSGEGDSGFSKTTQIMRAVTYCVQKGRELEMPVVINLSFGNTYGAHDGSSLLERFLDNAAEIGRTVICVGSGNEGNSSGHVTGFARERRTVELVVAGFERSLSVQLWKSYNDRFRISLRSPGGSLVNLMPERADASGGGYALRVENTRILVYFGEPTPYSVSQEIYLEMLPENGRDFLTSGIWNFILEPVSIVTGQYSFYLPPAVTRNGGTGFLEPTPDATLTIPSTASKVITVGAYDTQFDSYADFSGRGYEAEIMEGERLGLGTVKPDVAAPGVGILAPDPYGVYTAVTGTSFSTPIVSGCAALLMEWGIVRGNDPYLYGEKVKAYFRAGAQPIRGEGVYPNSKVGFGAVCIADSIPVFGR